MDYQDFEIIYSYTCHENKEVFIDTLRNLFYFNKNQKIGIIVNCNMAMFESLKDLDTSAEFKNVIINPNPFDKVKFTYDIIEGHLQNFKHCLNNNIRAKYFILLASNCMFHKDITMDIIEQYMNDDNIDITKNFQILQNNEHKWHWSTLLQNKKIITILNDANISNDYIIGCQHEGLILPFDIMEDILTFIDSHSIKQNIEKQTVFEEILLPTIYRHIIGNVPTNCCHVFWDKPNNIPTIDEIKVCVKPNIKQVVRNINDPIRTWLRSSNNNYVIAQ
jgi:hypothetical protein